MTRSGAVRVACLAGLLSLLGGLGQASATQAGATPVSSAAPADPRFVYVSGVVSGTVAALAIAVDGTLQSVPGSPVASGLGTLAVVVAPNGRQAYAANVGSRSISGWSVGAGGALTPLPGSPYDTQMSPADVAVSPDGRQLYVTTNEAGGSVLGFTIGTDGALHAQAGGAVPIGGSGGTTFIAVSPDGRHLFASSYGAGTVSTLDIKPDGSVSRGAMTQVKAGTLPIYLQISPDGRFVFVANESSNDVSAYRVSPTGELSAVPGSPFPAGGQPHGAVITSDSRTLYVPLSSTNATAAFAIGPNGTLTRLAGAPFTTGAAGDMTGSAAVSPDGHRLYVVEIGNLTSPASPSTVRTFAIGAAGELTALPGAAASSGVMFADGQSLMVTPDQGPTAVFRSAPAAGAGQVRFDGSASSAPDGRPVSRYDWTFGDGSSTTSRSPSVVHHYREPGAYTVTLTVTDAENCSLALVFHGQSASCNRDPRARITQRTTVEPLRLA